MAVIGHNITSLNAIKKNLTPGNIDINSSPKIVDVREKTMEISNLGKNVAVLGIDFEFQTDYKPDIGSIKIAGEIIYASQDNKKVLKEWEKNKRLPEEVDIEVKNFLLRKCLLLGASISQEMQLPPPLMIPFIRPKKGQEPNYIG